MTERGEEREQWALVYFFFLKKKQKKPKTGPAILQGKNIVHFLQNVINIRKVFLSPVFVS